MKQLSIVLFFTFFGLAKIAFGQEEPGSDFIRRVEPFVPAVIVENSYDNRFLARLEPNISTTDVNDTKNPVIYLFEWCGVRYEPHSTIVLETAAPARILVSSNGIVVTFGWHRPFSGVEVVVTYDGPKMAAIMDSRLVPFDTVAEVDPDIEDAKWVDFKRGILVVENHVVIRIVDGPTRRFSLLDLSEIEGTARDAFKEGRVRMANYSQRSVCEGGDIAVDP